MAQFPALEPKTRTPGLGSFPISVASGFGGGEMRFSHGAESFGDTLELFYEELTDVQAASLRSHYRGQNARHVSFTLPDIIWQAYPTTSPLVPVGGRWVYTSAPEEQHLRSGLFNVTVPLRYVGSEIASSQ